MKLKKKTIEELAIILKQEFGIEVRGKELESMAYSLVGYFNLLSIGYARDKVRKSST